MRPPRKPDDCDRSMMTNTSRAGDYPMPSMRALRQQYLAGGLLPGAVVEQILVRIAQVDRPEVWISRVDEQQLRQRAQALEQTLQSAGPELLQRMPLFGIPFAVKDNIDVAGMPTTAACPQFAFTPGRSAEVVERLEAAGAMLIGKTNLDQFATGLIGTRSPYGAVRNAIDPAIVSGGSSSGSAVAVALGLASFSLGTDTAGSGRVPAGLNGIVGLKPSRGLISTRGVFPACRTLDCVSIFAHTVGAAWEVLQVAAGFDAEDSFSRKVPMMGVKTRHYRIALPAELEFFGDHEAQDAFAATVARLRERDDCTLTTIDYTPFREAAALLYQSPWVAERLAAVGAFFNTHADALDPVVAGIIGQGANYTAVDAFNGHYRLADLRRQAEQELAGVDLLLVPTNPTMPRLADVPSAPVQRNSELGYYTNFVNFFDMAAIAVPAERRAGGMPAGVTLIGPCGADQRLAAAAQALFSNVDDAPRVANLPLPSNEPIVQLAVVGAHLDGQPLNWQLLERGAVRRDVTTTSKRYRLFRLAGSGMAKPGLVRAGAGPGADGAGAIIVEVWELPLRLFGELVAEVPAPLAIGSIELADGRWVKGFVCEPVAVEDAVEITRHGGWRAFLDSAESRS